jgi:hypothetical protein
MRSRVNVNVFCVRGIILGCIPICNFFFVLMAVSRIYFFNETPCMWVGSYCQNTLVAFQKTVVLVSWRSSRNGNSSKDSVCRHSLIFQNGTTFVHKLSDVHRKFTIQIFLTSFLDYFFLNSCRLHDPIKPWFSRKFIAIGLPFLNVVKELFVLCFPLSFFV